MGTDDVYTEPWLYWAQAAARHLSVARGCRELATSGGPIGPKLIRATLDELPASMQAIAAAACAVDGFHSAVRHAVSLPAQPGVPRSEAILRGLESVSELKVGDRARFATDLEWLFITRNATIHADVRRDRTWTHPSGLSVSAMAKDVGIEAAERALDVCQELIAACLNNPRKGGGLDDQWVQWRRGRLELALEG